MMLGLRRIQRQSWVLQMTHQQHSRKTRQHKTAGTPKTMLEVAVTAVAVILKMMMNTRRLSRSSEQRQLYCINTSKLKLALLC